MLLFNDVDLEQYIVIENRVEVEELAERINNTIDISSMNGEIYTGHKYGRKMIKVPFFIDARKSKNYVQIVRQIKNILNTNEESKLFLPDEPDKYYWAVVSSFTCDELYMGVGKGEIEFVCFDPYAYSDEYKLFESDDDKITTIQNDGTANCSPIINVSFTQDAHFLQCTNWDGRTILIGDRPSVDDGGSVKNELILHDPCRETTNWLPAGNVLDTSDADKIVEGNITISENGEHIIPSDFGTTIDQKWHGPAVRRNIGQNITDFEVVARIRHNSKAEGSTNNGGTNQPNGNYIVTTSVLNVRSGRGTNYSRLGSVKKNDKLNITDVKNGWGKISFKSKTGYVSMSYVKKYTSKIKQSYSKDGIITFAENDKIYTENKMGRLELYGFDKNGKRLFRIGIRDSERYFEYTQPEIYIGSKKVLHDGKSCPSPKKKTVKDENDSKKTKTISTESGRFGEWNEYYGEFVIRRETKNNKQYWSLIINKWEDGKEIKKPKLTKMNITSKDYPIEDLNHLVIWFGKHKDDAEVDDMALTDLKIRRINPLAKERPIINFTNGDELEIDCNEGRVNLNGTDRIDLVDIGSEFFDCDAGSTQFICQSDDTNISVATAIQEKWI